jgi:2',3'-cyclic-nucleotide 2'-phosphodiesterase (5'-nucleotidase family)
LRRRTLCALMAIACLWTSALTQENQEHWNKTTLEERLGTDDGAALAILFGANMRGNLELCDCNYPRGGLSRRVGYVEAFKKKFKDTPVVQVEGGFFFYASSGYAAIDLQNQQVALAYSRWPADVINLGRDDMVHARKLFVKDGLAERTKSFPMINNVISANCIFGPDASPPPAYIIKEVGGPRIFNGKRKLKIGFVGVAAPHAPSGGLRDSTVSNMFEATTRAVLKARKECDVLVVIAHCELEPALKLAEQNLDVDVVIASDSGGIYNPRRVGNTTVVSAAPGNIQEGDLRLYIDAEGHITYKFRANDLDNMIPADPAAEAFVKAARVDRERLR